MNVEYLLIYIQTDNEAADKARREAAPVVDRESQLPGVVGDILVASTKFSKEFRVVATEFEKDDDTNFHMDFIASFGNLR